MEPEFPESRIKSVTNPCLTIGLIGGTMAEPGQPLNRLSIPDISTLISDRPSVPSELGTIPFEVIAALDRGTHTVQTAPGEEPTVGHEINLGVFGKNKFGQINPAEIPKQGSGRHIPRNLAEARDSLNFITDTRSGAKNTAFRVNELRQIARNLNLTATGNKPELVNRIRTAVIEYYRLQV